MHAVGLMKMASESPITRFEGRHELYPYCSLAQSAVAGSGAFPPCCEALWTSLHSWSQV